MNKDTLTTHKYNCGVWLQKVDRQIREQRLLLAKMWLKLEKDPIYMDSEYDNYGNEYDKLQNLYKARNKLLDEQKSLYNKSKLRELGL